MRSRAVASASGLTNIPTLNLEETKKESQLLTLDETTMDSLRTPDLITEDRICNKEELDSLGLFSYAFCIICQEVIMPEAKMPVYCTLCQSAVYCKSCIQKWQTRRRECCYCKQTRPGQFQSALKRPEFAKVFELTKLRCVSYPNCLEVLPLTEIEKHEKITCTVRPCDQCNRSLKLGTISMQAHKELHCEQTKMSCEFCKVILTRSELINKHTCSAVYPSQSFAIKPDMVLNQQIIPADFSAVTSCFFCSNFLRRAQQCSQCLISACEACINASKGSSPTMRCPNKNCGATNKFQDLSRMAKNLLERLDIRCPDCNDVVKYTNYDAHQLKHHYCQYCSKNLTSWNEIRKHYYLTCTSYVIHCDNCEFIFTRETYVHHNCLDHYNLRLLEILLYALTFCVQAGSVGLFKSVNRSECNVFGGIRNFIVQLIPNSLFLFWTLCMWINYKSIQPTSKDVKQINDQQQHLYIGMGVCSVLIVFLNNASMKYNHSRWCSEPGNYNHLYIATDAETNYRDLTHWLLSILNIFINALGFLCIISLSTTFDRKKKMIIKNKLKTA